MLLPHLAKSHPVTSWVDLNAQAPASLLPPPAGNAVGSVQRCAHRVRRAAACAAVLEAALPAAITLIRACELVVPVPEVMLVVLDFASATL